MSFTNDATGVTEMSRSGNWTSLGGFDDVHAQYDTPYTVTLSVTSSTGSLADSRSLDITTTHGGAQTP